MIPFIYIPLKIAAANHLPITNQNVNAILGAKCNSKTDTEFEVISILVALFVKLTL